MSFSFIWTIQSFSLRNEKPGEKHPSLTYSTRYRNDEFKWRMHVYPMGFTEECKNYLSVYLRLVSCNQTEIKVKFQFHIINAQGVKAYTRGSDNADTFASGTFWGQKEFIKRDFLHNKANGLLPDDNLTILCEGSFEGVRVNLSGYSGFQDEVARCTLSEDLGSLFKSQKSGDVTISVGDKDLLVHKVILAARSAVFATMFAHEMKESQQNRVIIKDIDYEALREMLIYIYSGKSPNIESLSDRLLVAADKYNLGGLKTMCQEVLCSKVTVENAVDLLVLADKHCAEQLKVQANDFIRTHLKDMILTSAFTNIILKYPQIFAEAFTALANK